MVLQNFNSMGLMNRGFFRLGTIFGSIKQLQSPFLLLLAFINQQPCARFTRHRDVRTAVAV